MIVKKIILCFLLLFSHQNVTCQPQAWFGSLDHTILKVTAGAIASFAIYKTLLYTLNTLLCKTQNPSLLRLILRCIKCIDFNFDANAIYYKMCDNINYEKICTEKNIQLLQLFKILSQDYGVEPCNCQPRGCHLDNLYLAVKEGDCEYLNILFNYTNSARIKNFSQHDLYCLLNELIKNNTGDQKYFYTARALLQQTNVKNLSIYYDESGQYTLPLSRAAYCWLLAKQNNNTQLMESNKDIFGLLLSHQYDKNHINTFEFKSYHAGYIVDFLNHNQHSDLRDQFCHLTNHKTRQFFLKEAQNLQKRNFATWGGRVIIDRLTQSLQIKEK